MMASFLLYQWLKLPAAERIPLLSGKNTDGNAGSQGSGTGGLRKPVEGYPLKTKKAAASASKEAAIKKLIPLSDEEFKDF